MKFKSKTGQKVVIVGECPIHFYPAGGGFRSSMRAEDFFAEFTPVLEDDPYKVVRAQIADDGPTYWAYSNGRRWNGWAEPCFEMGQVQKMAEDIPGTFTYHEGLNAWIVTLEGDDEAVVYPEITIEVDGQPVKVFGIGASSWCWEELEGETT